MWPRDGAWGPLRDESSKHGIQRATGEDMIMEGRSDLCVSIVRGLVENEAVI